mgnify:CR=1 FL=1
MKTLAVTVEENLAQNLWDKYKTNNTKTNFGYLELFKLVQHTVKTCRQNNLDHQAFDLQALIDPALDYYENLIFLDGNLNCAAPHATEKLYAEAQEQFLDETHQINTLTNKVYSLNHKLKNANFTIKEHAAAQAKCTQIPPLKHVTNATSPGHIEKPVENLGNSDNLDTCSIELSSFFLEFFSEDHSLITLSSGKKCLRWQLLELQLKNRGETE